MSEGIPRGGDFERTPDAILEGIPLGNPHGTPQGIIEGSLGVITEGTPGGIPEETDEKIPI